MTPAARDALADYLAQILLDRYEAAHPEAFQPLPVASAPVEAHTAAACAP